MRDSPEQRARRAALAKTLEAAGADVLLLICRDGIGWQDICYCTGFTGTAGAFLMSAADAVLIVDPRYTLLAEETASCRVVTCTDVHMRSPLTAALEIVKKRGSRKLAYAGTDFPHSVFRAIANALGEGADTVDISPRLYAMRRRKSADEIRCVKRAADIAAKAFSEAIREIRPRMTERAFAALLSYRLHAHGSEFFDMVPIVTASGPRASSPHALPSERQFEPGDLVLVDFSARSGGYVCDMTRMFSIGRPSQHLSSIYSVLTWAQREAAQRLRPGARAADIDAAARNVLTSAELGSLFTHGTGHGIGLSIHEPPAVSAVSDAVLVEGDIVTIEPGVYKTGEFGMRVEDDYLITPNGAVCLTDGAKRELISV